MSNSNPLVGPRNAGPNERRAYEIKEYFESQNAAFMTAGISIVLALLGKSLLKSETIQVVSVKKGIQSFVVISVAGMAAHSLAQNMK